MSELEEEKVEKVAIFVTHGPEDPERQDGGGFLDDTSSCAEMLSSSGVLRN